MNREDKVDLLVAQSIAAIRDGRLFSLPPLRVLSTNQVRWDSNIRKCALASARTARSATATITVDGVVGDRCSEEVGSITTDDLDSDPLSTNVRTEHDHLEYEYPVIDDFCQSDVCTIHNGELDGRLVAIKILIVPFNKGARALKDELWQAAMLLQVLEAVPGLVKFKGAQLTSTPRFLVLEICLCSIYDMMYRQITATGSLLSNIQDKNGAPVSILNASDDGHATEKVQKEKQDKIMPFTAIERVQCMRAVAETLLRLHSLDVPYNDLTAKNVMLACDGRFLLAEFGLSSIIRKHTARNGSNASTKDEGNVEENTSTGRCKEIYKAPELFTASESAGTKAADCYAFGALLNEVLETCSGRSPGRTAQGKLFSYHGDKEAEVDPSNSLCGLTEEASERIVILIDKCCQKNPADRPTMHAVLQTLVSIDQMIQKNIRFAIFQATVSPEDLLGEGIDALPFLTDKSLLWKTFNFATSLCYQSMHRQTALGLSDKNLFPTNGSHEESKLEVNGNGDFEHQAKKEEETEMKARVYLDRKHSKIDKLIVNLLKKYAFVDDVVAISVCEFSAALSHNHSSNQAILGTQGICEELVNLLRCHGAVCNVERRLQLLEHALSALANLGNDELNLHKMIRCGACEIVIELLQTNCLDRSSSVVLTDIRPCIVVITHGFDSLSLFAGAGDQALERLQGADAPRVLIALLRVYCLEQDTLNVSVLAASGLSCIANMASSYQLSWLLFQLGACQLVLHVLQTWGSTSPSVVENGFVAIKALSALSCNRNEFVQLNAISDVLKFQEIGGAEQDLAIATAALEAFAELTSTAALNYCGKQNQASVVVNQPKLEIFQEDTKEKDQRKKSALLAVKLMRKASKIFDQQAQNNDLSVEVKGTDEHYQLIFSLLRKHGTCNVQIALAALKAFTNITSGDQEGKEQLDLLSRWGGCGLVLDLLNAHGSRNTAVAEYFAKVVNILAREEPNTLQLVQAGMYEVCLDLLRAYTALQHGSIILECVKALLTFFPRRSLSNLNGGDPLACHLLATVLQRYCSDHTQLDLLSHTLLAIQLVTFYQPNKSYFGCEEMACETIVVVLATHCFENVELTVVTLCSAANIAVVSSVAQQLATAGICDLLVDLLHTHRSYSVAEQGLRLLACLATVGKSVNRFNSENSGTVGKSGKIDSALAVNYQQLLGDLGACELVVKLMRTHLTNGTTAVHGEGVALQGSVAIHNLCNACCANKQRFLVEKAPELLQLVLSDRLLSQISRAEIVDAIKAIRY